MTDRARILYAEDDGDIAALVQMTLGFHGFDVEVCPDGETVLRRLRAGPRPAVLICDVMMPGKTGLDVIGELRADPDLVDLPVLMLSALARESERQQIRRAGATGLLTKPFDCEELAALVTDMASGRAAVADGEAAS